MPLATRITKLLDIEHPILLAPMGTIGGGALARAVTAAGGFGMIGGGYGDADWLRHEFAQAGNSRIGCGFITWSLATTPHLLDQVLAHRPAAIMLSFGDPGPFSTSIRAAGAKLICQVQTMAQAKEAADAGADLIVAQGAEAGGHGLTRGTIALVPAVASAWPDIPLAAAGGIADGRGLAAALMLGADGILAGTRFYATQESLGHSRAKQFIAGSDGEDTVRTTVFDTARGITWPQGYTGRALRNAFSERWHGHEEGLEREAEPEAARYEAARAAGDFDTAVVFAGEGAALIKDVPPAGEVVERMVREAVAQLARGASFVRA